MSGQVSSSDKFVYQKSPIPAEMHVVFEDATPKKFVEKVFKPGQHDVKIGRVVSSAKAKNDDAWTNLCLQLDGTGEKNLRVYLQYPNTDNLLYGANKTPYPFRTLRAFCKALGHDVTKDNFRSKLPALFGDEEKSLVGKSLRVNVGYKTGYVDYAGKDDSGQVRYVLKDRNNTALEDHGYFPDRKAALAYAASVGFPASEYVEVLSYVPAATTAAETTTGDIF